MDRETEQEPSEMVPCIHCEGQKVDAYNQACEPCEGTGEMERSTLYGMQLVFAGQLRILAAAMHYMLSEMPPGFKKACLSRKDVYELVSTADRMERIIQRLMQGQGERPAKDSK
jgi:hypothetical protein